MEELKISTEKVGRHFFSSNALLNIPISQVSAHVRRIEAVEKDLKALTDASATKDDIVRIRAELKKLYDGLHVGQYSNLLNGSQILTLSEEFLDLRAHVWGIREFIRYHILRTCFDAVYVEQDLHSLSKKDSTSVRI